MQLVIRIAKITPPVTHVTDSLSTKSVILKKNLSSFKQMEASKHV